MDNYLLLKFKNVESKANLPLCFKKYFIFKKFLVYFLLKQTSKILRSYYLHWIY